MLPSYESYSSSSARHCHSTCDAYARSGRPDRLPRPRRGRVARKNAAGGIIPHNSRPRGPGEEDADDDDGDDLVPSEGAE
jgi:hypothetical protein